jgi:predicted RNA binding protein YcfA (HicA-like mRNA interferase family)
MPKPIKHREMLRRFWQGPFQKGPHPFLWKEGLRLTIPNPHQGDIDWHLMKRILRQADISPGEWESA